MDEKYLKELIKLPILSTANDYIHGKTPLKISKEEYSSHLTNEMAKLVKHIMNENQKQIPILKRKNAEKSMSERQIKKLSVNTCRIREWLDLPLQLDFYHEKKGRQKFTKKGIYKMKKKKPRDMSSRSPKSNTKKFLKKEGKWWRRPRENRSDPF